MSIFHTGSDAAPAPAVAEPLLEAGAHDAGVELLGERLGFLDQGLWRSGESSQALRLSSLSKRRMAT